MEYFFSFSIIIYLNTMNGGMETWTECMLPDSMEEGKWVMTCHQNIQKREKEGRLATKFNN